MMNLSLQMIALVEMSITCAVVFIWALQKLSQQEVPLFVKIILLLVLANFFFWPLGMSLELSLAAYVRGITGDLSIATTFLLWSSMLTGNKAAPTPFKWLIVVIALAFYPFALGVSMVDPYVWGYGSLIFFIVVLVFAMICGIANWSKGVWMIGFAIIAWGVHWHESSNLWDYLLDPFLAVWAIISLFKAKLQKRREKARSGYLFRPG